MTAGRFNRLPRRRPSAAPRWVRWVVRRLHMHHLRCRISQLQHLCLRVRADGALPAADAALLEARLAELRCELYTLEQQA